MSSTSVLGRKGTCFLMYCGINSFQVRKVLREKRLTIYVYTHKYIHKSIYIHICNMHMCLRVGKRVSGQL